MTKHGLPGALDPVPAVLLALSALLCGRDRRCMQGQGDMSDMCAFPPRRRPESAADAHLE